MFGTFLLICAVIGIIGAILGWFFDNTQSFFSWVLSFFLPGIGMGIILCGIMWLGYFVGIFGSWHLFGCHPFLIGFIFGVVREIYLVIRSIVG